MTEDEAKTKWCPHARVGVRGEDGQWTGASFNSAILLDNDEKGRTDKQLCIASECMAWRREARGYPEGYCGLAGKP